MVKDIATHPNPSFSFNEFRNSTPLWLTVVGTEIYFAAYDHFPNPSNPNFSPTDRGYSLWKSDGTSTGTVRVKKGGNGGLGLQSIENLVELNGTLYFSGYFDNSGGLEKELWKSDGTSANTTQIKDISPNNSSLPSDFFTFNNELYFSAEDGTSGYKLWKSDGTSGGTSVLKAIDIRGTTGSEPIKLLEVAGSLYFSSHDDLFVTDGTSAGTQQLRNPSLSARYSTIGTKIYEFVEKSSTVSVPGAGGSTNQWAIQEYKSGFPSWRLLWFADGIRNSNLIKAGSSLYFFANNGVNGEELWKSDGTSAGTNLVKDIITGVDWVDSRFGQGIILGSNFYFSVNNDNKTELWKSDGTSAGTSLLKVINASDDDKINLFFKTDNLIYLSVREGTKTELWKSDGTSAGTVKIKDINLSNALAISNTSAFVGNTLFFVADDGTNGKELWKSDGTSAGTIMLKNINPTVGSNPANLINIGGVVYF